MSKRFTPCESTRDWEGILNQFGVGMVEMSLGHGWGIIMRYGKEKGAIIFSVETREGKSMEIRLNPSGKGSTEHRKMLFRGRR